MELEIGITYFDDTGKPWKVVREYGSHAYLLEYVNPSKAQLESICDRQGHFSFSEHYLVTENKVVDDFKNYAKMSPPTVRTEIKLDDGEAKISYEIEGIKWGGIALNNMDPVKMGWLFGVITNLLEDVSAKSFRRGQDSIRQNLKELLK